MSIGHVNQHAIPLPLEQIGDLCRKYRWNIATNKVDLLLEQLEPLVPTPPKSIP